MAETKKRGRQGTRGSLASDGSEAGVAAATRTTCLGMGLARDQRGTTAAGWAGTAVGGWAGTAVAGWA